jgi:hypothetical protein
MPAVTALPRLAHFCRRLWRETKAVSAMEFALATPLVLAMGGYGIEVSNLAVTNMRVSQYALQIADNASRIGVNSGLATYQLREGDINDVLQGLRLFSAGSKLTTYGRVTVSSLENLEQSYDDAPVQRIHWQRCVGLKAGTGFDSSYGTTSVSAATTPSAANAGVDAPSGMGAVGEKVNAPERNGVIFVEVNYQYQPLFGTVFVKPTKLHYVASVIVRDKRDFTQIYNPTPAATPSTCDKYTL